MQAFWKSSQVPGKNYATSSACYKRSELIKRKTRLPLGTCVADVLLYVDNKTTALGTTIEVPCLLTKCEP